MSLSTSLCSSIFTKADAIDCDNVCSSPIESTREGDESVTDFHSQLRNANAVPNVVVRFADSIDQAQMDESRCYYCGSEEDCDLCMQTHYHLCSKCRNSNPTQGWWEDRATHTAAPTNAVGDDSSFADEDAFHTIGSAVHPGHHNRS